MNFTISLHTGEQLEFNPTLPARLKKQQVFPNTLYSSGKWGNIIFQIFAQEGFTVWHSHFVFKSKTSIHTIANLESTRLHIIYRNDFVSRSDLGELVFKERQFNLIYFPTVDLLSEFMEAGEYTCIDIVYSKEYLQRFTPYLGGLEEFLSKSVSSVFSPDNLFATPAMIEAIGDVMSHRYYNDFAKFYMESKALEILTLAFEKLGEANGGNHRIDSEGEQRAKNVQQWLDQNQDHPGTLREIARRFGINEFKLKKEFKAVYGLPVFDYLLKTKLLKAKNLLLETDNPIADIAYDTGYANPGHFSRAFKKEFGVTPKYMRKYK